MNEIHLEQYARLIVKTGINLQPGQPLVITSPIESASFTRRLAEMAYREGARDVAVSWRDELLAKIRFLHAPEEVFDEYPSWQKELYLSNLKQGAAFVTIAAADPELMKEVEPGRLVRAHKAASSALEEYRERLMGNSNAWCVVAVPTVSWARKVFGGEPDKAVDKLWQAIFKAVRADGEDPVAAWSRQKENFRKRREFLNDRRFRYLVFKNGLGTDLKVELPADHIWLGGSGFTQGGVEFIPNLPTEEVFTLPKKNGANGRVVSSRPLHYNGNLIDGFSLTFCDGRVTDFSAAQGYEVLKRLIETDEGSRYLGEVALVPHNSPVSDQKLLFYNTLFDENAASHLALGKAYPVALKGGEAMNKDELLQAGVNDSLVHEDFMIGSGDMSVTGITADGTEIAVMKAGDFTF